MAEAKSGQSRRAERPLSPHLEIYAPPVNMVMSILHRITGAALYVGTLLLSWWLVAAASGPEYFAYMSSWFGTLIGKLVLFGYTWALIHHALGGVRHFIWDTGRGFEPKTIDNLSWATLVGSVLITAIIWTYVLGQPGGPQL
jgi:succinate dehydrogenase / fumarate reductase cytochrome b subunit